MPVGFFFVFLFAITRGDFTGRIVAFQCVFLVIHVVSYDFTLCWVRDFGGSYLGDSDASSCVQHDDVSWKIKK